MYKIKRVRLAFIMAILLSIVLFLFLLSNGKGGQHHTNKGEYITFVVVGGTGDLAKRKIWPSVAELVFKNELDLSSVLFYAGSRDTKTETFNLLDSYFSQLECPKEWGLTFHDCVEFNDRVFKSITAIELRTPQDYSKLNQQIKSKIDENNGLEVLRVFYLAVPPFAYSGIIESIHDHCTPTLGDLRVAIEKPFGRDTLSAESLAKDMRKYLSDSRVYLVDHYLHKEGVKLMRRFLKQNSAQLRPLWNNKYIKYVEIVAKESVDVKGRTAYYDKYGVVRDMLQSHLTELLTTFVTGVDVMEDLEDENELKHSILLKLTHPFAQSSFIAQYRGYQHHLNEESKGFNASRTPTYASVVLGVQDPNWFGVPFILTSGKTLLRREGFVHVVFRDEALSHFSLKNCIDSGDQYTGTLEMKFIFNSEELGTEEQVITIHPPMSNLVTDDLIVRHSSSGESSCDMNISPIVDTSAMSHAYTSVIDGLIDGNGHLFVPLTNIIQSWKVWTPLIQELESDTSLNLPIYDPDLADQLIVSPTERGTRIITSGYTTADPLTAGVIDTHKALWPSYFTKFNIKDRSIGVTYRSSTHWRLAYHIYLAALRSIEDKGVFNLALPGGSSPLDLFQLLAHSSYLSDFPGNFPWDKTHIWQTDERCVDTASRDSNINQLQRYLIDLIDIPSSNIHPMLPKRDSFRSLCSNHESTGTDSELGRYDKEVHQMFQDGGDGFDYVLLGMGRDGHIGSIFSQDATAKPPRTVGDHLAIVKLRDDYPITVKQRITLSLDTIINSKWIGLLITGDGKCEIIDKLYKYNDQAPMDDLPPVLQLITQTSEDKLTLYFDKNSVLNC